MDVEWIGGFVERKRQEITHHTDHHASPQITERAYIMLT